MDMKTVAMIVVIGMVGVPGCMSPSGTPKGCPYDTAALARTAAVPAVVDDARLYAALVKGGVELLNKGQTTKGATLIEQLQRKSCQLKLTAKPNHAPLPNSSLYARNKAGVLILAGLFKCGNCPDWHAGCSSGFVLTADGVAVTNYHVVNHPESATLVAMTVDGRVLPVTAVLAASKADDIAIIQLGGGNLQATPLLADAQVGTKVCVIGHPSGMFYTLCEGIVSRYFRQADSGGEVPRMAISADFAIGSSGGPIFDQCGNAVGMVAGTTSIYFTRENGKNDNLQMVLKYCVPTSSVLKMIAPPKES